MNIQVKAVIKSSHCYMSFTHDFTGMKQARKYSKSLKQSVVNSDTEVITNLYINNRI